MTLAERERYKMTTRKHLRNFAIIATCVFVSGYAIIILAGVLINKLSSL
jgi:hypothetical protein